jgi:uncharacterized protein YndB with AHSA1/START domain
MEQTKEKHEPIQQSVHVDCTVEEAFRLFTEGFSEWWPLAEDCEMEPWPGGRLFEATSTGEEADWGSIIVWDPPHRVEFTWYQGSRRDDHQTVDVEFLVEADGTRVTITHQGWHRSGVETCTSRFAEFICEQLLVMA